MEAVLVFEELTIASIPVRVVSARLEYSSRPFKKLHTSMAALRVNPDAVSALARRQEAHEAVDAVFESLRCAWRRGKGSTVHPATARSLGLKSSFVALPVT